MDEAVTSEDEEGFLGIYATSLSKLNIQNVDLVYKSTLRRVENAILLMNRMEKLT